MRKNSVKAAGKQVKTLTTPARFLEKAPRPDEMIMVPSPSLFMFFSLLPRTFKFSFCVFLLNYKTVSAVSFKPFATGVLVIVRYIV